MKKCIPSVEPNWLKRRKFIKLTKSRGHPSVYWNDIMDREALDSKGCYYCNRCSAKWDENEKQIN